MQARSGQRAKRAESRRAERSAPRALPTRRLSRLGGAMSSNFTATNAEGYELLMGRWSRHLAEPFLDFVGLPASGRVLDVGCGTGSLTRAIAKRMEGEVVGVDIAAPFVEHAMSHNGEVRISYEVQDASAMTFAPGTFDTAVSILVLNFIPEYRAAASEMIRVTCSGGRVAAACWSVEGCFTPIRVFWDTASALDLAASTARGRALSAPLTRHGELAHLFRELEARDVEEQGLTVWMRFRNFEDYWTPFTMGQATPGAYVASLDEPRRERLKMALREAYAQVVRTARAPLRR